jgi:hypothetical protein
VGHVVGLQRVDDVVRVWFYHLLLGSFPADGFGKLEPYIPEEDPPINETTPVTDSERDFLY